MENTATPPTPSTRADGLDPATAEALRRGRLARGWSYRQASSSLGVSAGHLHHLDHGRRVPSVSVALVLIDGYRLTSAVANALVAQAVADAGRDSPYHRGCGGERAGTRGSW